jgi:protein O-GlcNAc transferase
MISKKPSVNKIVFRALQVQEQGDVVEAEKLFRKALVGSPTDWVALFSLGRILQIEGKYGESLKFLDRLVLVNPNYVDGHTLRGVALEKLGRMDDAANAFSKVLRLAPDDASGLYSLGRILLARSEPIQALKYADRLIELYPTKAIYFHLLGVALEQIGRNREALQAFENGLLIFPNDVESINRKGSVQGKLGLIAEAIASFEQALAVLPTDETTLVNIGTLLYSSKQYVAADPIFKRLIAINPDHPYAKGLDVFNQLHHADWAHLEDSTATIVSDVRSAKRSCMSLAFMSLSDSARDQFLCTKIYSDHKFPKTNKRYWNGQKYKHDKIRVAYLSPDFREHPVGHLMAGVIERHDKSRFDTIAISLGVDDRSRLSQRFMAAFGKFVDASDMPTAKIAELLQSMEVDIVIDLAGFTHGSRTDLLASRVAPVQVNFLGYSGTMGADFIDYIIGDQDAIPAQERQYFSESVVYLPDTYMPFDSELSVSQITLTRQEVGLPETGFVFCSFNHIFKLNPGIFDVWMRLLREVKGSVLWLSKPDDFAVENLRSAAAKRGVSPERLIFAGRVPLVADHLARYGLAGIFLDTVPYNAHTTTKDALFAGLPVITCQGSAFSSRIAGSLLKAIGLTELVTESIDQYYELALALAQNPARLQELKLKLARNAIDSPLFDTTRFCRNLESAYTTMWERHQQGLPPEHFSVSSVIESGNA